MQNEGYSWKEDVEKDAISRRMMMVQDEKTDGYNDWPFIIP